MLALVHLSFVHMLSILILNFINFLINLFLFIFLHMFKSLKMFNIIITIFDKNSNQLKEFAFILFGEANVSVDLKFTLKFFHVTLAELATFYLNLLLNLIQVVNSNVLETLVGDVLQEDSTNCFFVFNVFSDDLY